LGRPAVTKITCRNLAEVPPDKPEYPIRWHLSSPNGAALMEFYCIKSQQGHFNYCTLGSNNTITN